jgi:cyanophycinase
MNQDTFTTGPTAGSLLLHGGVGLDNDKLFKKTFVELAGGPSNLIIYIPTAFSEEQLKSQHKIHLDPEFAAKRFGFNSALVLNTRDRKEADSELFVEPITKASAVFFTGGRQWRLADSYLHTRTHEELIRLLERGGVIAGSSAGATIQGSFLVRGNSQPDDNTIMIGDHTEGFGLINNCAIDQHLLQFNRQFDLVEVIEQNPELLGIGIDSQTTICVQRNEFAVFGKSCVAVYDKNIWSKENISVSPKKPKQYFKLLKHGQRFNLKKRKIVF